MRLNVESRALLADSLVDSLAPARLDCIQPVPEKFLRKVSRALGNWLLGLFGCTHQHMSRPFSRHGESYRVCIECGAHRRFNGEVSVGPFYFALVSTAELLEVNAHARGTPERDPILKFIGGVSHGSLAHDIDRELYGN
jgi:hypothetical protein